MLKLGIVSMAIGALQRRVLVDDHGAAGEFPGLHVAFCAGDVGVPSGQREMGLGVVVEAGRGPVVGVVTVGTVRFGVLGHELAVVGVVVACLALLRSAFEAGRIVGSVFVALAATDRAMHSK